MIAIDGLRIAIFGVCIVQPLLVASTTTWSSSSSSSSKNSSSNTAVYNVSPFHVSDLRDGTKDKELEHILTSTGILSIRVPIDHEDPKNTDPDKNLLSAVCNCAPSFTHIQGGDVNLLHDHRTTRHTIATATMGLHAPVPLPQADIVQYCGEDAIHDWELARDYVSHAVSYAFLPAMDRLFQTSFSSLSGGITTTTTTTTGKSDPTLLMKRNGDVYHSITSIVQDAIHLEHFHAYDKKTMVDPEQDVDSTRMGQEHSLEWHTDAGLFLAFLPAMNCQEGDDVKDDASFYIKVPKEDDTTSDEDEPRLVQYPTPGNSNEIIVNVMMGVGMEQWIQSPLKIKATRHAVKMNDDVFSRAWFGSMYLVPNDALIGDNVTFSDLKKNSFSHTMNRRFGDGKDVEDRDGSVVMGCGKGHMEHSSQKHGMHQGHSSMPFHRRRRLQHVGTFYKNDSIPSNIPLSIQKK
jgi:hypothetical protein